MLVDLGALRATLAEGLVEIRVVLGALLLALNLVLLSGHFILEVGEAIVLPPAECPHHVLALDAETTHARALLSGLLAVEFCVLLLFSARHALVARETADQVLDAVVRVMKFHLATRENLLTVLASNLLFLALELVEYLDIAQHQVGAVSARQCEVWAVCGVVVGHGVPPDW